LSSSQILSLLAVVAALVFGQILFKLSAQQIITNEGVWRFLGSFLSWQFLVALSVYGAATLVWVLLLKSIPLNRAYPFMALSFALVPVVSMILFSEALGGRYMLGLALLLGGLYLISTS
jgi:undecaprenyl phosphate-alpha-L-ara4N flippase subunit ArnE